MGWIVDWWSDFIRLIASNQLSRVCTTYQDAIATNGTVTAAVAVHPNISGATSLAGSFPGRQDEAEDENEVKFHGDPVFLEDRVSYIWKEE